MWGVVVLLVVSTLGGLRAAGTEMFRLAPMYKNDMVMQMAPKRSQLWGFGSERFAEIKVTLNSQSFYTTVGYNYSWQVQLSPQPPGGPHDISVTQTSIAQGGAQTLILTNVHFGDVWLCVGEGNMAFKTKDILNAKEVLNKTSKYDKIKIGWASKRASRIEENEIFVNWSPLTAGASRGFSALCLLYGMRMSEALRGARPIGLLLASQESTPIESWASTRVTSACATPPSEQGVGWVEASENSAMWNGTISPLTKNSIRGVIWSQGESNLGYNINLYACHLQTLISDFRSNFFDGIVPVPEEKNIAFPFGIFQAGPMNSDRLDAWGDLRWAQTMNRGTLPFDQVSEAFMATTYDLTDSASPFGGVLSRDKEPAATRLANAATALLYGFKHPMVGPTTNGGSRGESGVVGLPYDTNVTLLGTEGFSFRLPGGEWQAAPKFMQISASRVGVAVPPEAEALAYAWGATVCRQRCAVYSDDAERLPAQPWLWNLQRGAQNEVVTGPEVLNN